MTDRSLDAGVERLSRRLAARSTRRSFLHRLGQVAVFVAAGPTIAGLLLRRAEARVCGQSGVTPKCSTFDCDGPDDVWGWCWYASDGCCANDGLKKICDCCTVDYPNVHGYCPSGTNVRCIVESCGTDPRVLLVDLVPVEWTEAGYAAGALDAAPTSGTRAVLAPEADRWSQYVAAPLAGALSGPLLTVGEAGVTRELTDRLRSLGIVKVLGVGPLGDAAGTALIDAGFQFESISSTENRRIRSVEVAEAIGRVNDINRTVTVATEGLSAAAAPLAAAMAATNGFPLMIGAAAAGEVGAPTLYVGPEPAGAGVPAERTTGTTTLELSTELADLAAAAPFVDPKRVVIAPDGSSDVVDLVNLGAVMVLHPANRLGHLEQWLQDHSVRYGLLDTVYFTRGPGELTTEEYWRLQAAVNGFRVDQLQGVAGQGLPVIRQPWSERPLGAARIDGALDFGSAGPPGYWTELGQTLRD